MCEKFTKLLIFILPLLLPPETSKVLLTHGMHIGSEAADTL